MAKKLAKEDQPVNSGQGGITDQADGQVEGGATSDCPEGKVFDATSGNCEPVEGDGSVTPEAPEKVLDDGPEDTAGESLSIAELRKVSEKLDAILATEEDESEEEEEEKSEPESEEEDEPEAEATSGSDKASELARTTELAKKQKLLELRNEIEANELKVKAQELIAQKSALRAKVKNAAENAQPQFKTPADKKDVAYEHSVLNPSNWFSGVGQNADVPMSKVWNINKQGIFENYGGRQLHRVEGAREYNTPIPAEFRHQVTATEAIDGPPANDFMRIMSEQVLVLPNGKVVTPIRQFCEVKVLPPGTREAFFYDYGAVAFGAITEGSVIGDTSVVMRSAGGATAPRGARVQINFSDIEESPIDLVTANNRSFALESVNDESLEVLSTTYNDDAGSAGSGSTRKDDGGGTKDGRWINANTGGNLTTASADDTVTSAHTLSFKGIMRGKTIIRGEGLDVSNLVLYTTPKGIEDLLQDPNLDTYTGFSKAEIITEGVIEKVGGVNIVASSALAALKTGGVAGGARSVMFIPGVAFGLITGRDLTMEAQRRNEIQAVHLTGTQKIKGIVKNVEGTCRLSHA